MKKLLIVLLCVGSISAVGQTPSWRMKSWSAQWVTFPGQPLNLWSGIFPNEVKEYGVYKFRKTFNLTTKPTSFVVHVSADNRYKLFVNGVEVSHGPARGDAFHWNYETVDIAPHLVDGNNVIAALVWNDGALKPEAQISLMTAFVLQGATEAEQIVNTDKTWKCAKDESYQPLRARTTGYYVAGPGELVTTAKQIKKWNTRDFDDSAWEPARHVLPAQEKGAFDFSPNAWMLVPSPLPQMERSVQRLQSVKKSTGVKASSSFLAGTAALTIPANTKATLILDNGSLTNAYPTLHYSKGANASLSLTYTEALYIHTNEKIGDSWVPHMPKGNRNEIDGKLFIGKRDSLIIDGSSQQVYTPLWWRTYRYVMLSIQTRDEALIIDDFYGVFTGYPFQMQAKFDTDNPILQKNFEIGWRTARLCAFETYMDCPYYEQLQYVGDTRIQALVSLFNAGDDRLVRNAINQIDNSKLAEGITMSRYPTTMPQMIPTFSLWWIGMVHDYWRYRPDAEFVKSKLPGVRQVLNAFQGYQTSSGSLKNVPYWIFSDWVEGYGWRDGVAPVGKDGFSAMLDLQLLMAFQAASELEDNLGLKEQGRIYKAKAEQLKAEITNKYWDATKGMFADTPEKDFFSQHTNSLAILAGLSTGKEAEGIARKMLTDNTLAPASIYFKYYLHLALVKAGLGQDYLKWLGKWEENIKLGLTTWAEMSDVSNSRSDCHAWGSSPNVEFFRVVLGIDSDGPGFSRVKIEPHLGDLKKVGGEIPHPLGIIRTDYVFEKGKWSAVIVLPPGLKGTFVWNGQSIALSDGRNRIFP